ncbi:rhombosortase [Acinetobacter sp. ANC 4173]|uniref:rhombosortase n=1 Tax=Acinetobacter sp. ANC 4173 TaxID=2529837 RepID=UPI00103BA858|nr:rhombosortase [Acinetobacter sp. ANC 4173]TCB80934.1 rhombosortase [Acinetobacter sp. ANC 4173]
MNDPYFARKVVFIAGVASISACLQIFADYFIYWRPDLLEQFWRLWTGHWVHVGWIHYLLNMLAFACFPFIFPHVRIWHLAALLVVLSVCISLSFYYIFPDIEAYAGLSGVLHGAYVAVALIHLSYTYERKFAALVLGLIVLKLIWENTVGNTGTAELIGSPVLVEAHLLGAFWGMVFGLLYFLFHYRIVTSKS